MRPLLHPCLLNGRKGDPALYIETLFEKHAVLFDLGDLSNLPPRKIHRLEHVFVSHTHIDHFIGFDRLLRVLAGRRIDNTIPPLNLKPAGNQRESDNCAGDTDHEGD